MMPSSGSITSPVPLMISEVSLSATASSASSLPRRRSVRQSLASSTAARMQLAVLLELGFEQFEQGEGIGRGAGETGQHLAVAPSRRTLRALRLHHRVAERHLAVAGDGDAAVAAHRHDGGGVEDIGVLAGVHAASGEDWRGWGGPAASVKSAARGASPQRERAIHAAFEACTATLAAYRASRTARQARGDRLLRLRASPADAPRRRPWPGAGNPDACRSAWWRCRRGRAVPARRAGRRRIPGCGWRN